MSDFEDNPYPAELTKSLYKFALERQFTDFTITAKNTTIHCHKVVISAHSEFFRHICLSGNKEASLDYSVLRDDGRILAGVIEFMYLGVTQITVRNVEPLLLAANFIKFEQLKRKCENFITANLSIDNLLTYENLAKRVHLSNLRDACIQLSREKFHKVIKTEWLPSQTIDEVITYLKDDELQVTSEDQVLDALNLWLQNSKEPHDVKEESLEELLSCVRLQSCSKAKLEAVAKDTTVMEKLRFKIMEHLVHGWHGHAAPRKSYKETQAKEEEQDTRKAHSKTQLKEQEDDSKGLCSNPLPKISEDKTMTKETLVVVGGYTSGGVSYRNIAWMEESKDSVVPPSSICASLYAYSVCSEADSLIVSGGKSFALKTSESKVQKFCTTTSKWISLPDLLQAREYHDAALLNKHLYIIGGCYTEDPRKPQRCKTISKLDLDSLTWCECCNMSVGLSNPGIAVVSNQILLTGGRTDHRLSRYTALYDPVTDAWTDCQPMQKSCDCYHQTAAVGSMVFVGSGDGSLFQEYNVLTDQWSELQLPLKLKKDSAFVSHQGHILVLGGCIDWCPKDYVQRYDPSNKIWELEKETLPLPLYGHWALVLSVPK